MNKRSNACLLFIFMSYHEITPHIFSRTYAIVQELRLNKNNRHAILLQAVYASCITMYAITHAISLIRLLHTKGITLQGWTQNELACRPLTTTSQDHLSSFTKQDFEQIYYDLRQQFSLYTESTLRNYLLQTYNLYQYQEFIEFIQQWPEYKHHIRIIAKHIKTDTQLQDLLNNIQGFQEGELITFIEQEALRLQTISHVKQQPSY